LPIIADALNVTVQGALTNGKRFVFGLRERMELGDAARQFQSSGAEHRAIFPNPLHCDPLICVTREI
jgi:hypothetical protein